MKALNLRDIILGSQDGLVNVLGVVLGVAAGTQDLRVVLIAGLAATFAESISMAAVAFTSTDASYSEYQSALEKEKREVKEDPKRAEQDVKRSFQKLGFEGELLEEATKKITSNHKTWVNFMMREELDMGKEKESPVWSGIVVGLASTVGSFVPLVPLFFLRNITTGITFSLILSAIFLFVLGVFKAKVTIGSPTKSGLQLLVIGITSALIGYVVGLLIGGIII